MTTPPITIAHIKRVVAEAYGLRPSDLEKATRAHAILIPRHIAIALSKEITGRTLNEIGKFFGKVHYTSVLYAIREAPNRYPDEIAAMREAVLAPVPEPIKKEPIPIEEALPPPPPPQPREVIKPVFTPRKVRASPVVAIVPRRQSMTAYLMGDPGAGSARIDRGETSSGRAP